MHTQVVGFWQGDCSSACQEGGMPRCEPRWVCLFTGSPCCGELRTPPQGCIEGQVVNLVLKDRLEKSCPAYGRPMHTLGSGFWRGDCPLQPKKGGYPEADHDGFGLGAGRPCCGELGMPPCGCVCVCSGAAGSGQRCSGGHVPGGAPVTVAELCHPGNATRPLVCHVYVEQRAAEQRWAGLRPSSKVVMCRAGCP